MKRFEISFAFCLLLALPAHSHAADNAADAGTGGLPGNTVLQLRKPGDAPAGAADDVSGYSANDTLKLVRREARPLKTPDDYRHLMQAIGNARIVLLGEATHGTHEFYRSRSDITKQLIREKGFDAVAIEGDWPHSLPVDDYIAGGTRNDAAREAKAADSADQALRGFDRFPTWMWRNTDVAELVEWLRTYNGAVTPPREPVRFHGLDLYSPGASMHAVVRGLENIDAGRARKAKARYACFDRFTDAEQAYGEAVALGGQAGCEKEANTQLEELMSDRNAAPGDPAGEALFRIQQHARVARNAERYYRAMFAGAHESWNVRDTHMADTLDALARHIERRKGAPAKIVVWAHNTHVGDAGATEMGEQGEINLGQLVRKRYGPEQSFLVGFTTHEGTVLAASEWGDMPEVKTVRPSLPGSFSRIFHDTGLGNFFLPLRGRESMSPHLGAARLERAIGVIYRPETERASHYFTARLMRQFDAAIHFDSTRAVSPLDPLPEKSQ